MLNRRDNWGYDVFEFEFDCCRQQIEEMEERHRQAETDRSTEQAQKEDELEQTRQRLELMRSEAEKVKQEATQVITHWFLGDLDAILKRYFPVMFYLLVSSDPLMIMP